MARILVADNDERSRNEIAGILRNGNYQFVEVASDPEGARIIIDANLADVAILDLRLTNDLIEEDICGLTLAKTTSPLIPKIIVTQYENEKIRNKALGANVKGLPAAISFLYKDNLTKDLLLAVALALELKTTWFRRTQDEISQRLAHDYDHARRIAIAHTWLSLLLAIIFASPVVFIVYELHGPSHPPTQGALTMLFILVGSLGAEITNYLVARKLEFLYKRVDRFHTELLQTNKFDQLMALCEEIEQEPEREQFRAKVLEAALGRWIGINQNQIQTPPENINS
jgi:CheY-like chemotaxis protein